MTNKQREAIEYIQKQIDYFKEQIKFIEAVDCDYYEEEYELYKNRIKQFSTVLSIIKEQQEELKKQDKQIDLMAELVYKRFKAELLLEYGFENEEQLKQYFADLVEKE